MVAPIENDNTPGGAAARALTPGVLIKNDNTPFDS
jgi:hypothetical protein